MKKLINVYLKDYTTIHIGGQVKEMLFPESVEELLLVSECPFVIGGGSNLLISDRCFERVINMKYVNTAIEHHGNGHYVVGASVRLQTLINSINNDGYGGIEYLFPVPGLIGGSVAMNAGLSKKTNKNISDFILSVTGIENGAIKTWRKDECQFSFRQSIFKGTGLLITSVEFQFPKVDKDEAKQIINKQIEYRNKIQDKSKPNFGSVFCVCDRYIMAIARRLSIGKKVYFSHKTPNWLLNNGGNFKDAIKKIKRIEKIHRILKKPCKREVVTWE